MLCFCLFKIGLCYDMYDNDNDNDNHNDNDNDDIEEYIAFVKVIPYITIISYNIW